MLGLFAGLVLLKERRVRGDMIEVFKVMKGVNKVEKEKWFEMVGDGQRSTRQNTYVNEEGESMHRADIIKKESFRIDVRKNFFTVRVAEMWNNLPYHIKNATTINMFKSRIDAYLQNNALTSH